MNDLIRDSVPRIESLKVRNYQALREVDLERVTPLTVLLGPNGSGKSTVFDVFAFLSECFSDGLRRAWDKRGRFKELRSRGADGPLMIEVQYRRYPTSNLITYHLEIEEQPRGPVVSNEFLQLGRWYHYPAPFQFLRYKYGEREVVSGELPESERKRIAIPLTSPDVLAVNTRGQLANYFPVSALWRFITGWHLSYLSVTETRGNPEAGPQERLSRTGDNLANVIQYLREQHPARLEQIFAALRRRIPRLDQVDAKILDDGRLLLLVKDAPFDQPILARYASDGTLKLLAYLTLLYDPEPPPLIGIEEPENFLHPRLLRQLSEECGQATSRTQLIITTHSPSFIDPLKPEQAWVLYRADDGYTRARLTADMPRIREFIEAGATLGDLWMEGHFDVGDPFKA